MRIRRLEATEVRRAAILCAARNVFARQGYAATGVDDIAAQAGIAKGTVYLYFRSKEEIYLAAMLEDARRLNVLTRERMQAVDPWGEKLRAYLDVRLGYLDQHADFVRIFLSEIRALMVRGARMDCEFYAVLRESETLLSQVFAAAIARGEVRPVDPELAAMSTVDLVRGLLERRLMGWGRPNNSADAHFALDLLCRSLEAR